MVQPLQAALNARLEQDLIQLIQRHDYSGARQVLASQPHSRIDQLLMEGRIAKVRERFPEAIALFRKILIIDPNVVQAKRELAHTLLLNKNYGAAQTHTTELLRVDPDPSLRDTYQSFLSTIRHNRPFGLSGTFSILPSSNVNRGTTNTRFDTLLGTFSIDEISRETSGTGLYLGLSGFTQYVASDTRRHTLNLSLSSTRYEKQIYNSASARLSFGTEIATDFGGWYFSPYLRRTWAEVDSDMSTVGLALGALYQLNDTSRARVQISHEYRDYLYSDVQDGQNTLARFSLTHAFSPSLSLSGGMGVEHAKARAAHLQYDALSFFAGVTKDWAGGLQTALQLDIGSRDFVGDFPLTTASRHDTYQQISVNIRKDTIDFNGFTPELSCSYLINRSNVSFYDYDATDCQITIVKRF